jgi:PAS domain S-box-containing protein
MTLPTFTLLIVEATPASRELDRDYLLNDPSCTYELVVTTSVATGIELCHTRLFNGEAKPKIDAILLAYLWPDGNGLELLAALSSEDNLPPIVMVTGQGNERMAVQAIKLGAVDYLVERDLTPELLQSSLRSAILQGKGSANAKSPRQQQLPPDDEIFRVSIENMPDCFGIYSAIRSTTGAIEDFRIDYLNAAALKSDRMTATDIGTRLCEVSPVTCERELFEQYCQVVETGTPLVKEDLIYLDVSGAQRLTRAYSLHVSKLNDGFVASWRDVTARKQAELKLTASNQQITTIWESMTDAYLTIDRDWRLVYANSAATEIVRRLVGLAAPEFLGKSYWEIFPWSVGKTVEREYRRAMTDRIVTHFEVLYEPTGAWFEIHAYPSEIGLGIYFRDISKRKRIETDRLNAEQERDRFFNLSLDLLAIANFEGYFLRLNPVWEQTLGFTNAELMAQPYLNLVHPDDIVATIAAAQGLSRGEMAIRFENRYLCKDGSYRWLSWSSRPYDEQNLVYAVAHDITERKQAQAALEDRNQELNSFVHIVSHDLKAPLRAIAHLSEWIEDDLAGSLSADNQQQMTLLRSRVYRLEATIDGLLDYARVGRTDTQSEPIAVAQLLAEAIDSLSPPPTFKISIAPNLPTLHTKRILLSQVFANLIGNAIKHHHDVEHGVIQISAQTRGNFWEFAVSDDGPGIEPEYHTLVFGMFQAVNPQNRADSTGIGLAIVKKIVEAEGGTIRLASQLGKGTTFYFTWPHRS